MRGGCEVAVRVSPEDFPRLSSCKWAVAQDGYARGWFEGKTQLLHKVVVGEISDGLVVDHKDRNKLNNCRENLRCVSRSINAHNIVVSNSSGFRGVSKSKHKWRAECGQRHLGVFDTKEAAAAAYNQEAIRIYGEDALTNEICDTEQSPVRKTAPDVRDLPVGVYKRRSGGFMAALSVGGKFRHLGTFATSAEATAAVQVQKQSIKDLLADQPITRNGEGWAVFQINGRDCVVDDEDYKAYIGVPKEISNGYLMCGKRRERRFFHRIILDVSAGDKRIVDHVNGNKLDNRKQNLRVVNQSENIHNKRRRANPEVGVSRTGNKFRASIMKDYTNYHIGVFDTREEAIAARNQKARELYRSVAVQI